MLTALDLRYAVQCNTSEILECFSSSWRPFLKECAKIFVQSTFQNLRYQLRQFRSASGETSAESPFSLSGVRRAVEHCVEPRNLSDDSRASYGWTEQTLTQLLCMYAGPDIPSEEQQQPERELGSSPESVWVLSPWRACRPGVSRLCSSHLCSPLQLRPKQKS